MMNENPRISVITVVYNAKNTIEQTMLSVLSQTYKNIEYIIVDGVSTDGTLDIIKNYELKIKSGEFSNISFRYISEPDKGIYDAMNKGIDLATGEWLLFLGADDFLIGSIDDYYTKFINPKVVYYGDVIILPSKQKYGGKFSRYTLAIRNIPHQAIFYPRSLLKQHGYSLRYSILADYALNIFLFSKGVEFSYIDERISYFRFGGRSNTHRDINFEQDVNKIIKELGLLPYLYYYCRSFIGKIFRNLKAAIKDTKM